MTHKDYCYVCSCDVKGCQAELNSKKDIAWKMFEIVFGIDPSIVAKVKGPVPVVKQGFHFCSSHSTFYKEATLSIIHVYADTVCLNSQTKDGYGCWVTLIDILGGKPIENYQFSYKDFTSIWDEFINLPKIRSD